MRRFAIRSMRQTVKTPTNPIPHTGCGLGDALSVLHPDDAPEFHKRPRQADSLSEPVFASYASLDLSLGLASLPGGVGGDPEMKDG